MSGEDEARRKWQKPFANEEQAVALINSLWEFQVVDIKSLDSYDDRNFYIKANTTNGEEEFCLKLHNGVESANEVVIDGQNQIILCLAKQGVTVPAPVLSRNGRYTEYTVLPLRVPTDGQSECRHAVRVLSWVRPGTLMHDVPISHELLIKAGAFVGSVSRCLVTYEHKAAERVHSWDLKNMLGVRDFVQYINDEKRRALVSAVVDEFEAIVKPAMDSGKLRMSVIQGDANDANLIVRPRYGLELADVKSGDEIEMEGMIDFGDSVRTFTVCEPAIAVAYMMISAATPFVTKKEHGPVGTLQAAQCFLSGYNTVNRLTLEEKKVLITLIACRLAMSCTFGAFAYFKQPDNHYLLLHAQPAWYVLETLWGTPRKEVAKVLGLPSN